MPFLVIAVSWKTVAALAGAAAVGGVVWIANGPKGC